jgi:hypothetical protein
MIESFKPVCALDTAQSIMTILFTPHSAVLRCDKFLEIDLSNFWAEEFLDMSDQSLRQEIPADECLPHQFVRVFLLCFKESEIFEDEKGL